MKNKEELTRRVISILDNMLGLNEYPLDADFSNDLGMDSLDHVEFIINTERDLGVNISDDMADNMQSIESTVEELLKIA